MADISAAGPIFAAGFVPFSASGWEILFLPDIHNDELQQAGKPPVYHWLPNTVRLAQNDAGEYKFSFIHFEGIRSSDTNVGVAGTDNEVAGGLLGFSTTASPPAAVLDAVQQQLLNAFKGKDDKYWGWRSPIAPQFRPAPIVSNQTTITNLSPNPDGSVPSPAPAAAPGKGLVNGKPREIDLSPAPLTIATAMPRSVPRSSAMRSSNLDQWYCNLQGQGDGSVTPFAENAYSGLVGSLPAALIWASFHGGTGGISVWQKMKMRVWSPAVHLRIRGDWDRIQAHLSAAAHYGGVYWSGDLQAEFNYMRQSGDIEVLVEVDTSLPNADKLQEAIDKRSDLIFQKFLDAAQKVIFEPAPFQDKPAEASGGFMGFGGGVALKLRADMTHLQLNYDETREMAYLQEYPISGQLEGLYDAIKSDPTQEKKYFTTLYLADWERKVTRIVKPVVNWPDPAQQWVGEPVAFLSVQVGYPNTQGNVEWDGHVFQGSDGPNAGWNTAIEMKAQADVANPPQGWTPDKTFVKRQIHFTEAPSPLVNPYARVQVEQQVIDLDLGDNGRLVNDINLEVRVDQAGTLSVGPITLDVDLDGPKQVVEVTFQALGKQGNGQDHDPVKFSWSFADQTQPRYWMLFTGDPNFVARYQYQVHVIVKGGLLTKGMEWTGPWVETIASGPIMISVPTPDDPGVTKKDVPPFVTASMLAAAAAPPPTKKPVAATPPPTTKKPAAPVAPPPKVSKPSPRVTTGPPPTTSRGGPQPVFRDYSGWSIMPPPTSSRDVGTAGNGGTSFTGFSETPPSK
jgi:hypothetical protein